MSIIININKSEQRQAECLSLLKKQLKWAEEKTEYYNHRYRELGISYRDIKKLSDITKLPILDLDNIQQKYGGKAPFFLLTLPFSSVLRANIITINTLKFLQFTTSGEASRGIMQLEGLVKSVGINRSNVALVIGRSADIRLLNMRYALERLGVMNIYSEFRHYSDTAVITQILPDIIVTSQEYIGVFFRKIIDYKINMPSKIILIQKSLNYKIKSSIMKEYDTKIIRLYMPELFGGQIVAYRINDHKNWQLTDSFWAESIIKNSDNYHVDGEEGELLLTSLMSEAMPIIRWRTGEKAALNYYNN